VRAKTKQKEKRKEFAIAKEIAFAYVYLVRAIFNLFYRGIPIVKS